MGHTKAVDDRDRSTSSAPPDRHPPAPPPMPQVAPVVGGPVPTAPTGRQRSSSVTLGSARTGGARPRRARSGAITLGSARGGQVPQAPGLGDGDGGGLVGMDLAGSLANLDLDDATPEITVDGQSENLVNRLKASKRDARRKAGRKRIDESAEIAEHKRKKRDHTKGGTALSGQEARDLITAISGTRAESVWEVLADEGLSENARFNAVLRHLTGDPSSNQRVAHKFKRLQQNTARVSLHSYLVDRFGTGDNNARTGSYRTQYLLDVLEHGEPSLYYQALMALGVVTETGGRSLSKLKIHKKNKKTADQQRFFEIFDQLSEKDQNDLVEPGWHILGPAAQDEWARGKKDGRTKMMLGEVKNLATTAINPANLLSAQGRQEIDDSANRLKQATSHSGREEQRKAEVLEKGHGARERLGGKEDKQNQKADHGYKRLDAAREVRRARDIAERPNSTAAAARNLRDAQENLIVATIEAYFSTKKPPSFLLPGFAQLPPIKKQLYMINMEADLGETLARLCRDVDEKTRAEWVKSGTPIYETLKKWSADPRLLKNTKQGGGTLEELLSIISTGNALPIDWLDEDDEDKRHESVEGVRELAGLIRGAAVRGKRSKLFTSGRSDVYKQLDKLDRDQFELLLAALAKPDDLSKWTDSLQRADQLEAQNAARRRPSRTLTRRAGRARARAARYRRRCIDRFIELLEAMNLSGSKVEMILRRFNMQSVINDRATEANDPDARTKSAKAAEELNTIDGEQAAGFEGMFDKEGAYRHLMGQLKDPKAYKVKKWRVNHTKWRLKLLETLAHAGAADIAAIRSDTWMMKMLFERLEPGGAEQVDLAAHLLGFGFDYTILKTTAKATGGGSQDVASVWVGVGRLKTRAPDPEGKDGKLTHEQQDDLVTAQQTEVAEAVDMKPQVWAARLQVELDKSARAFSHEKGKVASNDKFSRVATLLTEARESAHRYARKPPEADKTAEGHSLPSAESVGDEARFARRYQQYAGSILKALPRHGRERLRDSSKFATLWELFATDKPISLDIRLERAKWNVGTTAGNRFKVPYVMAAIEDPPPLQFLDEWTDFDWLKQEKQKLDEREADAASTRQAVDDFDEADSTAQLGRQERRTQRRALVAADKKAQKSLRRSRIRVRDYIPRVRQDRFEFLEANFNTKTRKDLLDAVNSRIAKLVAKDPEVQAFYATSGVEAAAVNPDLISERVQFENELSGRQAVLATGRKLRAHGAQHDIMQEQLAIGAGRHRHAHGNLKRTGSKEEHRAALEAIDTDKLEEARENLEKAAEGFETLREKVVKKYAQYAKFATIILIAAAKIAIDVLTAGAATPLTTAILVAASRFVIKTGVEIALAAVKKQIMGDAIAESEIIWDTTIKGFVNAASGALSVGGAELSSALELLGPTNFLAAAPGGDGGASLGDFLANAGIKATRSFVTTTINTAYQQAKEEDPDATFAQKVAANHGSWLATNVFATSLMVGAGAIDQLQDVNAHSGLGADGKNLAGYNPDGTPIEDPEQQFRFNSSGQLVSREDEYDFQRDSSGALVRNPDGSVIPVGTSTTHHTTPSQLVTVTPPTVRGGAVVTPTVAFNDPGRWATGQLTAQMRQLGNKRNKKKINKALKGQIQDMLEPKNHSTHDVGRGVDHAVVLVLERIAAEQTWDDDFLTELGDLHKLIAKKDDGAAKKVREAALLRLHALEDEARSATTTQSAQIKVRARYKALRNQVHALGPAKDDDGDDA